MSENNFNKNIFIKVMLVIIAIFSLLTLAVVIDIDLRLINAINPSSNTKKKNLNSISKIYEKLPKYNDVINEKKPLIVFFYTDWCGYCQKFQPIFDKVIKNKNIKEKFNVTVINCELEENSELLKEYGINGFPSVFLVSKEKNIKEKVENSELFAENAQKNLTDLFFDFTVQNKL